MLTLLAMVNMQETFYFNGKNAFFEGCMCSYPQVHFDSPNIAGVLSEMVKTFKTYW